MTITVTSEELANYKGQLTSWSVKRIEYLNELKQSPVVTDAKSADFGTKIDFVAEMAKWEQDNPAPKLVSI